jgi:hypothetical protein
MPIFTCSKCGVVDNTAVSGYWSRVHMDGLDALCSQCNPEIGKWHGRFERKTPEEFGVVSGPDGFLYGPEDPYLAQLQKKRKEKDAKS